MVGRIALAQRSQFGAQLLQAFEFLLRVVRFAGFALERLHFPSDADHVRMLRSVYPGHSGILRLQRAQAIFRTEDAFPGQRHHGRIGLDLDELGVKIEAPFFHGLELAYHIGQLRFGAVADLQVQLRQFGEPSHVEFLELGEPAFDFGNMRRHALGLFREEARGLLGLLLAVLQVLVQVEGHQLIRHFLGLLRTFAVVGKRKGDSRIRAAAPATAHIRSDQVELDVLAHALENFLGRLALALLRDTDRTFRRFASACCAS
jgi:hypothetical protein